MKATIFQLLRYADGQRDPFPHKNRYILKFLATGIDNIIDTLLSKTANIFVHFNFEIKSYYEKTLFSTLFYVSTLTLSMASIAAIQSQIETEILANQEDAKAQFRLSLMYGKGLKNIKGLIYQAIKSY